MTGASMFGGPESFIVLEGRVLGCFDGTAGVCFSLATGRGIVAVSGGIDSGLAQSVRQKNPSKQNIEASRHSTGLN